MPFVFTPGLWLFILATPVLLGILVTAWQFREMNTGRAFLILITCALIWVVGFSFETAATTLETKILFANIQFVGLCFIPNAWLYLACSYRGITRPTRDWILLAFLPALTNLTIWTNSFHHWFRGVPYLDTATASFSILVSDYQFWFYFVHAPTGYLFIIATILVLIRGLRKAKIIYRHQTLFLLAALLLPVVVDMLYILGYSPIKHYNITPAVLSVSAALIAWNLFRFQFLDLRPMARDLIIDNLQDGVIVLDSKNRIVDFNPAAERYAKLTAPAIGRNPQELQVKLMEELDNLAEQGKSWAEIKVNEDPALYYELRFSEIKTPTGFQVGRVVTLRDITERAELFHKTHYAATYDSLTNTLNRRQFTALAELEFHKLPPQPGRPISIIMFDLDRFKQINDQHGHAAGDKAIKLAAHTCQKLIRPADILGRFGGDEFAVFLGNTDSRSAIKAAERLRKGIEKITFSINRRKIRVTGSFGICSSEKENETFEKILIRADDALYRAKRLGGNRIVSDQFPVT